MKRDVRFQGAVIRGDRILLIGNHEKATGRRYWLLPGGGLEEGEPRPGEEPEPEASGFAICDVRWFDLSRPDSWGSDLDGDAITLPQLHAIRRWGRCPGA